MTTGKVVLCFVGICVSCSAVSTAAEPLEIVDSAAKYRKLIGQLASTNEKARTHVDGDEQKVIFPAGYDRAVQQRIAEVRRQLNDEFESALPYLAEALNDDRYCMTVMWAEGDAYYNWSVGRICRDLIASRLEVYRGPLSFTGPSHWHRYNFPFTKEWQAARPNRTLCELQVEAIDWARELRKVDSRANAIFDGAQELRRLQELRDSITKTGKPAQGSRLIPMITTDRPSRFE